MRGIGIDSEVEIYALKQSYWTLIHGIKKGRAIETEPTASSICRVRIRLAILNQIEVA
jgi:hypothetical protein